MPQCHQCKNAFEITSDDLAFYRKIETPFTEGGAEQVYCEKCYLETIY